MKMWTYNRDFTLDRLAISVRMTAVLDGLTSVLLVDGVEVARDHTPSAGLEAVRNHRLAATLQGGRTLEVEAGYINWYNVGIAARVDGALVHESHPGRIIAFPAAFVKMTAETTASGESAYDPDALKRNKVPIAVDIATGLLFFIVAKLTNLQTAALVGAGVGIALVIVDRFVNVDLIGGMAIFGIVMLLISGGFAILFADDEIIKQRSTIVGLIGSALFFADGLTGGKRLGKGMARYIAYRDIDPRRLAMAMGATGAIVAVLNFAVVKLVSTDVWLFYTTFGDIPVTIALVLLAIRYARFGTLRRAPS